MKTYDSSIDTKKHIRRVFDLLMLFVDLIISRAENHDKSKLNTPEKEIFDIYTPKLKESTFGSLEYVQFLSEMSVALTHHYANNRHHPEHFTNGIKDMTLIDLIEMLADWKAASERHSDGDIHKSIEINSKRFVIDDQLKNILINTVKYLENGAKIENDLFNSLANN